MFVLIVESAEEAVKFYTEKLAFDIIDADISKEDDQTLSSTHLRKGKCFIQIRTPLVEELAEFSFIKRCASRCTCLYVEMKKGIERYFDRCNKKGIKIASELKTHPDGSKSFSIRDPFGIKLIFGQPSLQRSKITELSICGLIIKQSEIDLKNKTQTETLINKIVDHLKKFGILRRSGKKFAKHKIKEFALKR
jgi:uncharacterized glyoxalase superfamily protein PhnB